ncbi:MULTISPECIES: hypothetical protein [unclassified Sphingopyxis]|jgi:hypothetical protein|uniref:hypothetical protein n=1 Tax=unclassified Sphingopyxis TaxID=2614943 RepID=UPI0007835C4A|nr:MULTISPECIES: hypothetical protein [unclassified Sphingopyxis]USI76346.1 hypothetical protein KEC45_16490 [Sphingopyxis sp. USTB-05]
MPTKSLYLFGYESPAEFRSNADAGTDFESSTGVWISGAGEEQALQWGRTVAEHFVAWLFEHSGNEPYSWEAAQFADWIETNPSIQKAATSFPIVAIGELPDFAQLLRQA